MNDERKSIISLTITAFPLIFIIAAILVSFNAVRNFNVLKNTDTIDATVVSVTEDTYRDSDDFEHYIYYTNVDYEYKGQKYKNINLGTLSSKRKIGSSIPIRIDKENPSLAYTTDSSDVFYPMVGALAFLIFGCFLFFKFLKWQIEDIKEEKKKGKRIIAFKLPTRAELITGLVLAAIVGVFIVLQIYVLSGMIIGVVVSGFFFLMWVDVCLLK